MLDHPDLGKRGRYRGKGGCGGEYLSEGTFTDTSQEDEVEEIYVAVKVDGLC